MNPVLPKEDLLTTDMATKEFQKSFKEFSKLTKKLIIISPNPDVDFGHFKVESHHLGELKKMITFSYTSALSIAKSFLQKISVEHFILPLNVSSLFGVRKKFPYSNLL